MKTAIATLLFLALLTGCAANGGAKAGSDDLLKNPRLLLSAEPAGITLHGLALGDAEEKIPQDRIADRNPAGWVIFNDNTRVRVVDGRIVALGLWDSPRLERLGIRSRQQIEQVFGPPAAVDEVKYAVDTVHIYRYPDRRLDVFWDEAQEAVIAVNVTSPSAGGDAAE